MKIIQAMKQLKDLARKQSDLQEKIGLHCAHTSIDTPVYGDQEKTTEVVAGWLQSHEDISQEIARLKVAIQRTNIATMVDIPLGDKTVKKSISEWLARRGSRANAGDGLASSDHQAWKKLTDKGIREGLMQITPGQPPVQVTIIRNYDPAARDAKLELYRSEPSIIDGTLEVVNAVTSLIEE